MSAGARRLLPLVAWLLALAVLLQALTAGLGVFHTPGWWSSHRTWVHAWEWLSVLAVMLAYVGRAVRTVKLLAWATVVLLFVQYATVGMRTRSGLEGLAALHTVGALALFWVAVELGRRSRHPGDGPATGSVA